MNLEKSIKSWNGKSVDYIADIFNRHAGDKHFVDTLIRLIKIPDCQKGATWLLKACADRGHEFSQRESAKIMSSLIQLEDWEARLHILQSLSVLTIEAKKKQTLEHFLRATLCDPNKFVRAWSYNGFYVLASQYPEYRAETKEIFDMAMQDEAASVKARIRNIVKKGLWTEPGR